MMGPSLPNPFDHSLDGSRHHLEAVNPPQDALDAAIHEALRSQPLAAPPPLLYAMVMRNVRRQPLPKFRIHWLDLALSLFAAGMLLVGWLALRYLPQVWLNYMRLQVLYQINKLWYIDIPLFTWTVIVIGLFLAGLLAVFMLQPRRRFN